MCLQRIAPVIDTRHGRRVKTRRMHGLQEIELIPTSRWQRLMGRQPRENVFRQVNNLICGSPIFQIYHDGILAILRSHGMTLEEGRNELIEIYVTVLRHYGGSGELTERHADEIDRLGELMGFSKELMKEIDTRELAKLKTAAG
jgi:hypothetical protein